MTWDEIWKMVSAVIVFFGGAGAITVATVKYAIGIMSKRIEQKYEAKFDRELEKYKVLSYEKTYVTKARFDTEFQAFKDINKAMFETTVALDAYGVALNQSLNTRVLSSLLEEGKINADLIGTEDEFGRIIKVDLGRDGVINEYKGC